MAIIWAHDYRIEVYNDRYELWIVDLGKLCQDESKTYIEEYFYRRLYPEAPVKYTNVWSIDQLII